MKYLLSTVGSILLVVVLFLGILSVKTIGAGDRGVVMRFGEVQEVIMQPGLNFKAPLIDRVRKMDVQTQKVEYTADGASADLQDVQIAVALNFHLNPDQVNLLWKEIGRDYQSRIINPAIEESIKSASALFTAEELITKRSEVKEEVKIFLKGRLNANYMTLDDISIVNFQFSEQFDKAIEAKVTAEQDALAEQNRLKQVEFQAEQKVVQAEAEATAIRIKASALLANPKLVEMEAVQKWNGIMPQYMLGGAVPFINIK